MGRANDLLCLIALPDSYVLAIETQKSSNGYAIFDKVCQKLQILQKDFFGLQIKDDKSGVRWLNLRNPLSLEASCSCPLKLTFSIKYFVQPHFLLEDSTREAFFKVTSSCFVSEQFNIVGEEFVNEAASILLHCSEANNENSESSEKHILPHDSDECRLTKVKAMSSMLTISGSTEARRMFLNKLSHCMNTVGHRYSATLNGSDVDLCVFPDGLMFLNDKLEIITSHVWPLIHQASHNSCEVTIRLVSSESLLFVMRSKISANAFYRDLTEVYTFFHCDTVKDAVIGQTCRDLKGTIVSFFNENSTLGKAYVFDIEHTLKETSDLIRRHIFHHHHKTSPITWSHNLEKKEGKPTESELKSLSCDCKAVQYLNELKESLTCAVCVESCINTVFIPCGHVFCCMVCSSKLDHCPLCKEVISASQLIYLPMRPFSID